MSVNMAAYMAQRRKCRRQELIKLLGGVCVRCGTTKYLEFDHKDSATRNFRLNGKNLDKPWEVLLKEAEKCQLLCRPHHWAKTLEAGEVGVEHGGGLTGKKNCPCKLCKARKAEYMRNYGHSSRVAQSGSSSALLRRRL